MPVSSHPALNRLVNAQARRSDIHEVVLCTFRESDGQGHAASSGTWHGGPVTPSTPFLIASTSKIFATAMILRLAETGQLRLDDPVTRFFAPGRLEGLHRLRGTDHTGAITLRHLMAHSSGLPDYFEGRRHGGTRFADQLMRGQDMAYGLDEVLRWSRDEMRPHFPPGQGRRALYSDTNFYLLGEVIAAAAAMPLAEALDALVNVPLGLKATAFYTPGAPCLPLRLRQSEVHIPQALASMPVDGGMVSTGEDLLTFIRGFFGGTLFPKARLAELQDWRRVFFPLMAGTGLLMFRVPRLFSPLRRQPALIGHSGISGAFAFHCPERGISLAGTVNQLSGRSLPYRLMLEALAALR